MTIPSIKHLRICKQSANWEPNLVPKPVFLVAAAIDLVASSLAADAQQISQLDQAVTRLELVTAGDEQLLDDLAAAIEASQVELVRLERQHDLLRSQLESAE